MWIGFQLKIAFPGLLLFRTPSFFVWRNFSYKSSSRYWFFQERKLLSKDLWKFISQWSQREALVTANTVN